MEAEIITIGDEIISGHTIDTNSAYIAPRLAEIGLPVTYKSAVGDDLKKMEEAIHLALRRAGVVITTGGLGPTDDDITKKAIVRVFKRNLVFQEDVLEDIRRRFAARGIKMPAINQNQALLPQGAIYLPNRLGSAVGIAIIEDDKIFISLPGVPREVQVIADEELLPFLKKYVRGEVIKIIKIRTTGIIESALAEKIAPATAKLPENVRLAYLPSYSGVDLRVVATGPSEDSARESAERVALKIREAAEKYIYAEGEISLEEIIGTILAKRGQKLATAESCTAGLLAGQITRIPGSSTYFELGVVTYSNQSKIDLLGVQAETLERFGAVSVETAEEMARGIRTRAGVDYGLAVTGIAGPDGGTPEKPIGTVIIAAASAQTVVSRRFQLGIDRESNRRRTVYIALEALRRLLLGIE